MLIIRQVASVVLVTLLAAGPVHASPPVTMLKASVSSASGKPLAGAQLRMVSLDSGRSVSAATNSAGVVAAELTPGLYTVNTVGGYEQVGGPRVVSLASGEVLSASLSFATPEQTPIATPPTMTLDGSSCVVAGLYPQLQTVIVPADKVVKARLYFKSGLSSEVFYVDMVPGVGNYSATLPRPTVQASPITFWVEVTGVDYGQTRSAEKQMVVVKKAPDCKGKLAAVASSGPATALSATGAAGLPAGFAAGVGGAAAGGAAAGGGILGLSTTTALIVGGGIVAGGLIIAGTTGNSSPSK